ncbi:MULTISPECIES: LLM class flavin-dependent oxidoreductase [Pseudomonas]|uniref:Monooxygenase n=1 Tax=Pseudomonas monteilii TaxID=76759 RepID=A0AAE6RCV1_9PSED|nr:MULTISPECIES: LLM class flavin-dependent oxidoreductase [Pseudomonas]MDH4549887.1 LLM class flavin-dependent oxidoreductase [Pseudomonas sp. BN607]MDH4846085.1 LLM class flavin-dependent oxidoreductase [Pseudomonas sp. BN605]MDH4858757.1 LLM class flavin-dependent oxidoreductase [Pseudomonas sp. BN505]NWL08036.1 LLM class flavin-dependent oxidoreductase [Pseudomonas hunanensis]QHB28798.1 monooxygenase [Pseudomonas monteilii]
MKFNLMQTGVIGRRYEIEAGMAGQRPELYQRFLEEVRGYVSLADGLGYAGYCQPEHHLQIEGFEINNHPGMFSLYVGMHSKRMKAGIMGYTLPTHNPVRIAEEIATLDHMLQGRLFVGFTRGYHARWVDSYAAIRGVSATTVDMVKSKDAMDELNREIFEESLQVIKKAWTNDVFSHKGKHWQFPPNGGSAGHPAYAEFGKGMDADGIVRQIGIAPLCYQKPHPRIYGGFAGSMKTVDFWAREGGKPIVLSGDLDFCEALWKRYAESAKAAGNEVPREEVAAWGGFLMLTNDKGKAKELMAEHQWFWDKWFIPFGQRMPNVLIGSADEIADRIGEAHDRLGFNELFLMFGQGHLNPDQNNEELEKFASLVAPRFSSKDATGIYV